MVSNRPTVLGLALVGPRELAAPSVHQEDRRKAAYREPLGSAERRSSFEAANVAFELGQAEQAFDFSEKVRPFVVEVRVPRARMDIPRELLTNQWFELSDK